MRDENSLHANAFDFFVGLDQFVAHLHHHAESEIGLLYRGEDLGGVDVASGHQGFDRPVGVSDAVTVSGEFAANGAWGRVS